MGQKTHPLGFRLGITQEHKSTWYANFNQYANILKKMIKFELILIQFQKQIVFQMFK
jgi:ribosomal protein S3